MFVSWSMVPPIIQQPARGGHVVYVLVDPRDNRVRYVGVTRVSLRRRLELHLQEPTNLGTAGWFRELASERLTPVIRPLFSVIGGKWEQAEMYWIAWFQARGKLYNVDPGGKCRDDKGNLRASKTKAAYRFRRLVAWEIERGTHVGPTPTLRGRFERDRGDRKPKKPRHRWGVDPNAIATKLAEASARQMAPRIDSPAKPPRKRKKKAAAQADSAMDRRWRLLWRGWPIP